MCKVPVVDINELLQKGRERYIFMYNKKKKEKRIYHRSTW